MNPPYKRPTLAIFHLCLFVVALGGLLTRQVGAEEEIFSARVVSIQDGDTMTVVDSERREFVLRLSAIDAPEITQVYGQEAKKALGELVLKKPVVVRAYDLDKYGRILADVEVGGVDISVNLVGRGLAWHAAHFADDETLSDHQKLAQLQGLGLWQDAKPCQPWMWRHKDEPGYTEPSPINPDQAYDPLLNFGTVRRPLFEFFGRPVDGGVGSTKMQDAAAVDKVNQRNQLLLRRLLRKYGYKN